MRYLASQWLAQSPQTNQGRERRNWNRFLLYLPKAPNGAEKNREGKDKVHGQLTLHECEKDAKRKNTTQAPYIPSNGEI